MHGMAMLCMGCRTSNVEWFLCSKCGCLCIWCTGGHDPAAEARPKRSRGFSVEPALCCLFGCAQVGMTPLQKQYYKWILTRNYKELNKVGRCRYSWGACALGDFALGWSTAQPRPKPAGHTCCCRKPLACQCHVWSLSLQPDEPLELDCAVAGVQGSGDAAEHHHGPQEVLQPPLPL